MEDKVCSFFGHREIMLTEELYTTILTEIEKSVDLGCRIFYFGGFGEFDNLCYQIVSKLKAERPNLHIRRIYCVPQEALLRKKSRWLLDGEYEDVVFLVPKLSGWYRSIFFRNCAMIDGSDVIIFYAENRKESGAYKAYRYALTKKEKTVINLYPIK